VISRPLLLALTSAALLILAFPSFNQAWCAWIALVPWLVALRGATPRQAFTRSYLVGLLFFLGSMWWLVHLTAFGGPAAILGWLVLSAYLALYFGAFGLLARHQTSDIRLQEKQFL
jgi:apolipoprotein N-acyltransferase